MLESSKHKTWDRLKLVCRQPYAHTSSKARQFGLAFVGVMTSRSNAIPNTPKPTNNTNQNKLNKFFDSLGKGTPKLSSPTPTQMVAGQDVLTPKSNRLLVPPSLTKSIEKESPSQLKSSDKVLQKESKADGSSPARAPLSKFAIGQFKEEVDCFFQDIHVEELLQRNCIKVAHLRQQMEQQRAKPLTVELKKLFMELVSDKFAAVKKQMGKGKENRPNTPSSQAGERKNHGSDNFKSISETPSRSVVSSMNGSAKRSDEVRCPNCGSMLPRTLISIHKGICKTVAKAKKPSPTPPKTPIRTVVSTPSIISQGNVSTASIVKTPMASSSSSATSSVWLKAGVTPSDGGTSSSGSSTSETPNRSEAKRPSNNRNKLCFDLGDSDEEGECRARKRLKTQEQTQPQQDSGKIRKVKSHFSSKSVKQHNSDGISSSPPAELKEVQKSRTSTPPQREIIEVEAGTSSRTDVDISANDFAEQSECPMCFKKFPQERIMIHASICNGNSTSTRVDDNDDNSNSSDDLPDVLIGSAKGGESAKRTSELDGGGSGIFAGAGGSVGDSDSGKVPCPICGTSVSQTIIEIHVNACLDGS